MTTTAAQTCTCTETWRRNRNASYSDTLLHMPDWTAYGLHHWIDCPLAVRDSQIADALNEAARLKAERDEAVRLIEESLKHDGLEHSGMIDGEDHFADECGRCQWITLPMRAFLDRIREGE